MSRAPRRGAHGGLGQNVPTGKGFPIEELRRTVELVRFSFGRCGCEYFAWSFSFRPIPGITSSTPLTELARIARDLVASVPTRELPLGPLAEALTEETLAKAHEMNDGVYGMSIGTPPTP